MAISVFQFWYANELAPSTVAPSLGVRIATVRGTEQQGLTPITARVTIHNSSSSKAVVLGSLYRLTAAHVDPKPAAASMEADAAINIDAAIKNNYKSREGIHRQLQWGAVFPPRSYLG